MRPYFLIAVLLLVGCGGHVPPVVVPPTPPVAVDVARTLFKTTGRDIGPAIITDVISDTGLITRNANTASLDFETHSIYQIDESANCIRAVAEETWNKSPKYPHYIQIYPDTPCWAVLHATSAATNPKFSSRYFWKQFNPDGSQIGDTYLDGTWEDYTVFTPGSTLLEYYKDTTAAKQPTDVYCVFSVYDSQGLAKLENGACP